MQPLLKFILLVTFQIPAICISIFILIYFAFDRTIRSKRENHIWFILLILNFFYLISDLPMTMSYLYYGRILFETDGYCVWWTWYELSLNTLGLQLMTWASIERHFFVFHSHTIMRVQWKVWILHIIPVILCFTWVLTFHFILIVISPFCINTWNFEVVRCGSPCVFTIENPLYGLIEFVANIAFPLAVLCLANISLIIRVIYQKISHNQIIHWRRHRKMTFQLWMISSVYLAFWLPFTLSQIIRITVMPTFFLDQYDTILFIIYFIPLLLPIVCLNTYPELLRKMRDIIQRRIRRNRVDVRTIRNIH
ncbi:hypothetical protein I4U23_013297 [Adineta vaga]|nr:hypothetical protein I4U23_013297 [Adineta vaga]